MPDQPARSAENVPDIRRDAAEARRALYGEPSADPVRWEYKSTKQLSDGMLNAYGRDGWELVQIENGFAFFKRRLIDGGDA